MAKSRLNSNIYKNIFAYEPLDYGFVLDKMENTITSFNEICQPNHGFEINDVVYISEDGTYGKALADGTIRSNVAGIVTKIASDSIFTVTHVGTVDYEKLPYTDTSILYLSDRRAGKLGHYLDMYDKIYIPVGIYVGSKMVINIQEGVAGTYLQPYSNDSRFESYTPEELNNVIETVWDCA